MLTEYQIPAVQDGYAVIPAVLTYTFSMASLSAKDLAKLIFEPPSLSRMFSVISVKSDKRVDVTGFDIDTSETFCVEMTTSFIRFYLLPAVTGGQTREELQGQELQGMGVAKKVWEKLQRWVTVTEGGDSR